MSRAKYCKFFRECKSKAVYRIPHSNLALCKDHFLANVEKRVQKLVKKSHIIRREGKNKILIALSGGKDSQVLLSIMKKSYPENIELHGLYIELGISDENYSKDSGIIAQSLCNKLNVPFHEINVKQQNGFNIDDIYNLKQIVEENKQKSKNDQIRGECSYCGLLKRYHINKFAVENDFSVVLTGHNLTDEATSLVNNFFNVDIGFLKKLSEVEVVEIMATTIEDIKSCIKRNRHNVPAEVIAKMCIDFEPCFSESNVTVLGV